MKFKIYIIIILFNLVTFLNAQERKVQWQSTAATVPDLQLFHSNHIANLPSAETLQRNDLQFEISHRFVTPVNGGYEAFWGLDDGANIRIALDYALTNYILFSVGRSNIFDNLDLNAKWKFLQVRNEHLPLVAAIRAGAAFNTADIGAIEDQNQFYGQLVLNTLIMKKLGIGIVPSYLENSNILSSETKNSSTLGIYGQFYVSPLWSVFAEWNTTLSGYKNLYNPLTFGIELETGGHFFKIFLSNSSNLNTAQYLVGADLKDEWRIGFNITRLLKLNF